MGKPSFTITYPGNNIAPCVVEFTSTPQMPEEEIYLFDFKDGRLYYCTTGERVVRHEYQKAGKYGVTAIASDQKTMSDPVEVTIVGTPIPDPEPVPQPGWFSKVWSAVIALLKAVFGR